MVKFYIRMSLMQEEEFTDQHGQTARVNREIVGASVAEFHKDGSIPALNTYRGLEEKFAPLIREEIKKHL